MEPISPIPVEEGIVGMTFPQAIAKVIEGKLIKRMSWTGQLTYGLMKDGWLCIYVDGDFHIWKVNDGDMQSDDWIVMEQSN